MSIGKREGIANITARLFRDEKTREGLRQQFS